MPFSRFMAFSNSVLLFHIHYPGSGNGVLDTASLSPSDLILSILPSRSFPQVLPPPSGTYPESLQGTVDVGAGQSFTNNHQQQLVPFQGFSLCPAVVWSFSTSSSVSVFFSCLPPEFVQGQFGVQLTAQLWGSLGVWSSNVSTLRVSEVYTDSWSCVRRSRSV